jgi:hypothetical protein
VHIKDFKACCCCFLHCNNTIEEVDGALPLSFSSLTHRRRQQQEVAIVFFISTPPNKKAMATNYRHLLR